MLAGSRHITFVTLVGIVDLLIVIVDLLQGQATLQAVNQVFSNSRPWLASTVGGNGRLRRRLLFADGKPLFELWRKCSAEQLLALNIVIKDLCGGTGGGIWRRRRRLGPRGLILATTFLSRTLWREGRPQLQVVQ